MDLRDTIMTSERIAEVTGIAFCDARLRVTRQIAYFKRHAAFKKFGAEYCRARIKLLEKDKKDLQAAHAILFFKGRSTFVQPKDRLSE